MFKFKGRLKSFAGDTQASIAVMFGVAAVPFMLAAGVAVARSLSGKSPGRRHRLRAG